MASRRLLTGVSRSSLLNYLLAVIIGSALMAGCGTTKEAKNNAEIPSKNDNTSESSAGISQQMVALINTHRSELGDVYASKKNTVPAIFRQRANARDIGNPNQGYRIQILSTRDVAQADSIANDYRFWADSTMSKYVPKAYVFFKQPYYKVHIGNFQFHDQAQKLTRMLKARYPGAWVVHDKIEPHLVPPATTQFGQQ